MFQFQNIESMTKHSRNSHLVSCLQLLRNSGPSQIYQECAPGHQAPKTALDDASGAYFQVGFWWASKLKFLMLLGYTTRPLLGASGRNIPQGGPGFTSGFAFQI